MFRSKNRRKVKTLLEVVSEEIEWFWRVRLGKLARIYLAVSCLFCLFISTYTIVILFQPVVYYDGFALSGYIAPLYYNLRVAGSPVRYPFLDSLNIISVFTLVFAVINIILSVLGIIGYNKKWRHWIVFIPSATGSGALLVTLLYSRLRYTAFSAIPALPHTVMVTGMSTGRIFIEPSRPRYTWVYYLSWNSTYFFILYNILVALTAGSLVILLLKPRTPVTPVKPRKARGEKSKLSVLLSRVREIFTRSKR